MGITQIGNCGSPIWTAEGWLVITHGVGAMRRYCIGASLFDLDDPSKEIGRLKEPYFLHEKMNGRICTQWFYSCGAIIHNNSLFCPMPYPTIPRLWGRGYAELLDALKRSQ
jgi:predicted GH43/DUF377 family glycosyl hydrolase